MPRGDEAAAPAPLSSQLDYDSPAVRMVWRISAIEATNDGSPAPHDTALAS
jgi:hypothetical protein